MTQRRRPSSVTLTPHHPVSGCQLLRLLQRLPRELICLPALSGAATGLDRRPTPSLDRTRIGFRRGRGPSGRLSRLAGTGHDGVGACGDLYLLMDRRLVGRGTQGRRLVFQHNPREPGAQTSPEGFGRLLLQEVVGSPRGVAEGFRDGLRLPGSGFHRRMPVVFDGIRLSQLEVLVVDDGFTDASAQIASRFQVRLLTRDRLGLSEARNMALEQARGGFVA
jgi:hypothetical protein